MHPSTDDLGARGLAERCAFGQAAAAVGVEE
jgi:hypothetical protein